MSAHTRRAGTGRRTGRSKVWLNQRHVAVCMNRMGALLLCGLFAAVPLGSQAQTRGSTSIELGKGTVTIRYGAPSLNGRTIDEMIVPNFAWRMGMNEPTTLEASVDLEFYGRRLPAGKYVIFARPDEHKNWTLIVSSQTSGSVLDPAAVVFEAPLFLTEDQQVEDTLRISLGKSVITASMTVSWGTYRLRTVFKAR